jgi:hypothetical protein
MDIKLNGEDWEVLTPTGWSDFIGIKRELSTNGLIITFENNDSIYCTTDHKFKNINNEKIYAKDLITGDSLLFKFGSLKIIKIEKENKQNYFYDLLEVEKDHEYYVNDCCVMNCVILDEYAFVPDNIASDFMSSVYPTMSSGKTSKMIITSTTNGMNHFFNIWKGALEGKNDKGDANDKGNSYYPIKIPWDSVPGRDQEFKRKTIKNIGLLLWNQEYACKFLGSSNTLIDADVLEKVQVREPIASKWNGAFSIYKEPEPNCLYIVGADSGKGLGKDFALAQVLKITNEFDIEQVATYRNNTIDPKRFAKVLIAICDYYNMCSLMLETNDVAGSLTASELWNVYEFERLLNCDSKGLGIEATKRTKPLACMLLKRYMEDGFLKVCDRETLYELSRFIEIRPNVFEAENRGHDDCVTSLYWALYFLETEFYEGKDNSVKQLDAEDKINYTEPVSFFTDGVDIY